MGKSKFIVFYVEKDMQVMIIKIALLTQKMSHGIVHLEEDTLYK